MEGELVPRMLQETMSECHISSKKKKKNTHTHTHTHTHKEIRKYDSYTEK